MGTVDAETHSGLSQGTSEVMEVARVGGSLCDPSLVSQFQLVPH